MAESAREADVYDRVYQAERPELFFKATPHRVVGHGADVRIRADSAWNVPEAELPLYLPQAKIYDGGCALGPCLLLADEPLASSTEIALRVVRLATDVFRGSARLSQMSRRPE